MIFALLDEPINSIAVKSNSHTIRNTILSETRTKKWFTRIIVILVLHDCTVLCIHTQRLCRRISHCGSSWVSSITTKRNKPTVSLHSIGLCVLWNGAHSRGWAGGWGDCRGGSRYSILWWHRKWKVAVIAWRRFKTNFIQLTVYLIKLFNFNIL